MIRFLLLIVVFYTFDVAGQSIKNKFILGRTTGKMPALEYGLGTDRLGGAKMGFLDTGVLVKIIDSTIINYKIQLSENHYAYLQKSTIVKDSTISPTSNFLTGSILINGDDIYDYVTLTLSEKLPYRTMQLIHPSKIVVDVFGATSNTNWITHRTSATEIKNVYYEQIEDDVYRVHIELNHEQHWGHSIYYQDKKLVIKVKRQPALCEIGKMKIFIDAGHGGENNGASGTITGIKEKEYTLLIAKQLQNELRRKGATVIMTRTKDTSLSMIERIEMVKNEDPHFLISIHLNSSVKDSVQGASTYYKHIGFRPLSKYIQESMVRIGLKDFGNVGNFNFALNGPTDFINCLVEVAFLSNKDDEALITDSEFHKAVAVQITEGIIEWLKICK